MRLLGFHITFGTYGTRVHGDPRNTVDREHNQYGEPVIGYDEHRWEKEKGLLKYRPVEFNAPQMILVESLLPEICERGGWIYQMGAAGPDHVHVVLSSREDPKPIRKILKRWLTQALAAHFLGEPGCPQPGEPWFAECGSIRWIFEEDGEYFENAVDYVRRQRATERPQIVKIEDLGEVDLEL